MCDVRYLLAVAIVAAVLIFGLRTRVTDLQPPDGLELHALAAPISLYRGENVAIVGYLSVPTGTFELGTYACQGALCRRSLWRHVTGPDNVWLKLGSVHFDGPEQDGAIELRVFQADGVRDQVVGVWRRDVTLLDSPPAVRPVTDPARAALSPVAVGDPQDDVLATFSAPLPSERVRP